VKKQRRLEKHSTELKHTLAQSDVIEVLRSVIDSGTSTTLEQPEYLTTTKVSNLSLREKYGPEAAVKCDVYAPPSKDVVHRDITPEGSNEIEEVSTNDNSEIEVIKSGSNVTELHKTVNVTYPVYVHKIDREKGVIWLQNGSVMFDIDLKSNEHVDVSDGCEYQFTLYNDLTFDLDLLTKQSDCA
jgi:hypothetical protein